MQSVPRVVSADRLGGGILVSFDDGKSALYPAALLYANLNHAQLVEEADPNDAADEPVAV